MIGRAGLCALALLAAACGPREPDEPVQAASEGAAPEQAGSAQIMAGLKWETAVSGAGVGLTLSDAGGTPLLRIACVRGPAKMTVVAERFTPIGSEERLTLGVGGEAFTFVADPTAERPAGVEAEAPISAELLDRLPGANEISAVYGTQKLGPHMPPDPPSTAAFVSACRKVAGGSAPALAPAAKTAAPVVPAAFRGEWNMTLAECGTAMNDSRLVITADDVRFYESGGPVTAVRPQGREAVELTVALSGEGEGPTPTSHRFRLTEGGRALVSDDGTLTRRRCPD